MPAKKAARRPAEIYELKITLLGSKPPIWRRFAVPADITLDHLHAVIQIVMGWFDSHLHQFIIGRERTCYGEPDPFFDSDTIDECGVKLNQVVKKVKERFVYEYDFGDGWEHGVELLKIAPPQEGVRYPLCLAGKRACPPEDCGGLWGYNELLEVIANPKHPEHEERLEWLGGELDPEGFDLDGVNADLKALR